MVVAHELGHVLGLGHEPRRCALMNTRLVTLSPERCIPPLEPWRWRCRILERDDVRGAVRLYGGRVRSRGRPICDLFARARHAGLADRGARRLRRDRDDLRRPPAGRPPPHVIAGPESYLVAYRPNTCPASPDDPGSITTAGLWTVPASGVQRVLLSAPASGRYCIAVWARDGVGRFSAKPATTFADVVLP